LQLLTGAQQAGAAGAQQAAGAEQPQPRLKNALASLASNTDRVTTATTMAANAANLRLIIFLPSNIAETQADFEIRPPDEKQLPRLCTTQGFRHGAELFPSQLPTVAPSPLILNFVQIQALSGSNARHPDW
jgi:hypothetical protein